VPLHLAEVALAAASVTAPSSTAASSGPKRASAA
jgi:hypothetical protein